MNAYVKPTVLTTYTLTSQVLGSNLIANPDFSGGNTGFTSDYTYVSPNITEGQYWVGTNPAAWNGAMNSCGDHASGTGSMMIVNGSPATGSKVWTQTITVVPNTNYQFSTWLTSVSSPNPANLQIFHQQHQAG